MKEITNTSYVCSYCGYTSDDARRVQDHEWDCLNNPDKLRPVTIYEYSIRLNMLDGMVSDQVDIYSWPGSFNVKTRKAIRSGQKTALPISEDTPIYDLRWNGHKRVIIMYTIHKCASKASVALYNKAQELLDQHVAILAEHNNKIHKGFVI